MQEKLIVKTMAEYAAEGKEPDILYWVGCAGSYDARAQKVSKAFAKLLNKAGVSFAILGS
ncbi:MAG TPA: (Fe-S)-binding protein, partial [Bacteroidetes bacterium]|nr:(Fe-S)-binding protein [Bacteroidota bacterium]